MSETEFQHLQPGDIIVSVFSGQPYLVAANYGTRVTAVQTADVTNASEWTLVRKSERTSHE
jgi:hypothetical protein